MKLWRGASWKRRLSVVSAGTAVSMIAAVGVGYAVTDVPSPSASSIEQGLVLLYADGSPMARFGTNRVLVRLEQISPAAQKAVLAAEDRDFYSEPGISVRGIARALFANVKGGGVSQGGSTITQQYAKNAFLTQERTFKRKLKEVFIAVKMARTVSKDQVLEDYLNTIYFGRGAFGIEAASMTYFKRHASTLDVSQAAVLASSIRSPAGYDPERHPERARERWVYVLDGMVKKGWLTQEQRAAAAYPKVEPQSVGGGVAPDLDHIRSQVIAELERHSFGEDRIAAGGLVVRTTIVRQAQDAARTAVADKLPTLSGKDPAVAAVVAVEPGTGKVVAYYGGDKAAGFDYADDGTGVQPGSSMKPYVLAAALKAGKKLSDRYDGHSPQDICGQQGVRNDAGDPPFGQIDLVTALVHSVNTVYMRLACDVGPKKVADLAHAAGIPASQKLGGDHPGAGIALGIYEVHPLDQAVGYATFAAKGTHAAPYFVQQVKDRHGNVIYKARQQTDEAFSAEVAADATYAMQQVVSRGTGTRAKIPGRPTAGKTGTTQSNTNGWFCGFTPQLAAAVWVGRAHGSPFSGLYGGTVPAKIFRAFMRDALKDQPVEQFPKSAGAPAAVPSATPGATLSPSASPTPSATPSVLITLPPLSGSPTPSPSTTPSESPTPFLTP